MSFQLTPGFDMHTNNIIRCLDSYDAAKTDKEKDELQRETLTTACNLLATVDEINLKTKIGHYYWPTPKPYSAKSWPKYFSRKSSLKHSS